MYEDDKLLDDAGHTVTNSFVQNRLAKQRIIQEYSIETETKTNAIEAGQSALLKSIIDSQLALATIFRGASQHMDEEIISEITELRAEVQSTARELESGGDSVLAELKHSEIKVKSLNGNIPLRNPLSSLELCAMTCILILQRPGGVQGGLTSRIAIQRLFTGNVQLRLGNPLQHIVDCGSLSIQTVDSPYSYVASDPNFNILVFFSLSIQTIK
jgi:hypothetical protein